ncbi:MAG TPA: septation ring formation regulator EzrA [Erysipelotrichaceae bacterium]|nr:septation ring formation regulator EzrA [Erysipelotrichaceae bacterium]
MPMAQIYENIVNSGWIYVIIALFFFLIILIVLRINKKKKMRRRIDSIQIKMNNLRSHPFNADISKMDAIARININIKDTAQQCKKDFDIIQNNLKNCTSLLQDAVEAFDTNNLRVCDEKLVEIEKVMEETRALTTKLSDVTNAVLNQSSMQRRRINELKDKYREIKLMINDNPNNYTFSWEAVAEISNAISHKFSDFEAIMGASKYDEAATLSEEISLSIDIFNDLALKLPELINLARVIIPNKIGELNSSYLVTKAQGAYLDHLSVDSVIDTINETLNDVLAKIKICDIESVDNKLTDCETKINNLYSSIEKEKIAHRQLINTINECKSILETTKEILDALKNKEKDSIERYELTETVDNITKAVKTYEGNKTAFDSLNDSFNANSIPSTTLLISFEELLNDIKVAIKQCQNINIEIASTKTEELRIKELVDQFTVVLNEVKVSIRLSRLPNISDKYQQDIDLAEKYLEQLNGMLSSEVMDIKKATDFVSQTQKHILSLFKNVETLTKTTSAIESCIIVANQYRPIYPEVDSALYSAELAYRNGEFTKAKRLIVSAIERVNPQLANEINNKINNSLDPQKEG